MANRQPYLASVTEGSMVEPHTADCWEDDPKSSTSDIITTIIGKIFDESSRLLGC